MRELFYYTGNLQCGSEPAALRKRVTHLLTILGLRLQASVVLKFIYYYVVLSISTSLNHLLFRLF